MQAYNAGNLMKGRHGGLPLQFALYLQDAPLRGCLIRGSGSEGEQGTRAIMRGRASEVGSMDTTGAFSCAPYSLYNLVFVLKSTLCLY